MNKIFKVVWSKAKHTYVVASELAKGVTKGASAGKKTAAVLAVAVLLCGGMRNGYAAEGDLKINTATTGTDAYALMKEGSDASSSTAVDRISVKGRINANSLVVGTGNKAILGVGSVAIGGVNNISYTDAAILAGSSNIAYGRYSAIAGGASNKITKAGCYSTVAGGSGNEVSGQYGTVAGGAGNKATGNYTTASGGSGNTASGTYSTAAGGSQNEAIGQYATVTGGY